MRFLPNMMAGVILAAGTLLVVTLHSQTEGTPQPHPPHTASSGSPKVYAGKPVMNGYSLKDFPDFISKWHFVTVRYRKDTREMRLTYANDKAWKALLAGGKNYPDGAVFGKVGIMTEDDPGFVNSVVPSGAKRYQLMVMDAQKHKETDGWGYAVFDAAGLTFEQDPKEQTAACHACHQLVPERHYVFSQPMHLEVGVAAGPDIPAGPFLPKVAFVTRKTNSLPKKLKEAVPAPFREVRVIEHDISHKLFQGTIDEIRPMLVQEALRAHLPAVLVNEKGTRFSMAIAKWKAPPCKLGDGRDGVEMLALFTIKPGPKEYYPIQNFTYCEAPVAP